MTEDIRSLVEPLISYPEDLEITRMDKSDNPNRKEQTYRIRCRKEDIGKLIGRHGVISDSLRTIVNVSTKNQRKKIHLRFESFPEEENY